MSDPFKYSDEDFKNKSTINAMAEKYNLSDYNTSDDNGYTPLCYMALNGLRPDLIVYLLNNKSADASKVCDKGSAPLELACMSGNAEAVTALIGGSVVERDEDGNIIYTDISKPPEFQPKKDATGNPLPKRDSEDNVIYEKDDYGTSYPLGYKEDPDNVVSVKPEIQYAEYKTEEDPFDKGRVVVKSVRRIPPLSTKSVIYKYEKDGSHTPMRDIDGKPLKQYNKDSLQPINKNDEVTFKPIRNKYEYVWDYESQPEYEVNYCEKTTKIIDPEDPEPKKSATVTPKEILAASSNKDPFILMAMAEKYSEYWDPTLAGRDTYFNSDKESPLIAACRMQALDSVKFILNKIYGTEIGGTLRTVNAIFHRTIEYVKDDSNTAEYACKIASDLNDKTLINAFKNNIDVEYLNNSKGTGAYTGNLSSEICDHVYSLIDAGVLSRGLDPSNELLIEKWPYIKPDPWTDGWPSP